MPTKPTILNKIISYSTFFTVIAGAVWVAVTTLNDLTEPQASQKPEALMTGLALEGRDIFQAQGCATCHLSKTLNGSLILAGALFAPHFPFQEASMTKAQLKTFLLGPPNNSNDSLSENPLFHSPAYPQLLVDSIKGHETQAKMLALSNTIQTYETATLITASERAAGVSQIDALVTYISESALKSEHSSANR